MEIDNVQSRTGVTLVGGGSPSQADIDAALAVAPCLVAADGGANYCFRYGKLPTAVIGDFDSIDDQTKSNFPHSRMIEVEEQESTDFEKALCRIDAPFVLATGFTAARLDHTLATLNVLSRGIGPPCLILGENDVTFASPKSLHLNLPTSTRISLFPLSPISGTSKGLQWPIDGLVLTPNGQVGTSNRAVGPISLEFDQHGCLIILPRSELKAALNALTD